MCGHERILFLTRNKDETLQKIGVDCSLSDTEIEQSEGGDYVAQCGDYQHLKCD